MNPSAMRFPLRLKFESADEERAFIKASQPGRLRHFIISGWISLLVYNLFLVNDWLVAPEVFKLGLTLRLGLLTTFGLVALTLGMVFRETILKLPPAAIESVVVLSGVMAALSVALVLSSHHMEGSVWRVFYHGGFVPVIIYGTVVQRLRFQAACVLTGSVVLIHWVSMAMNSAVAGAPVWPMLLFVATIAGYTLLMNFRLEYEERQCYLQQRRARLLKEQLDQTCLQLDQASCLDPLTEVANRRGLDRYLKEHWPHGLKADRPMSLLLIDVDHFKPFNDFYGHPAGDQCLRLVAKALARGGGAARGMLARWGGEEFVFLLPGVDAPAGVAMANRLVAAVRNADIRHERSPVAPAVTVSIGLACTDGLPASEDVWGDLLAKADEALYQAKHLGRNRVACLAPGLSER